jgi:hypothetical protein
MKLAALSSIAAGCLVLAGCSSTPAKVDSGPIRAGTFSFVNTGPKPAPGFTDNRPAVHAVIQDAITKNLAARGLSRTASGGDVTVAYLVITGNNASTASISDYFGYGEDASALHQQAHSAYTGSKNPNYFEAGTLVIDVIDTRTFKLLQRNHATRPLLRNLPEDARAARVQEVVDEILRDLRVVRP